MNRRILTPTLALDEDRKQWHAAFVSVPIQRRDDSDRAAGAVSSNVC